MGWRQSCHLSVQVPIPISLGMLRLLFVGFINHPLVSWLSFWRLCGFILCIWGSTWVPIGLPLFLPRVLVVCWWHWMFSSKETTSSLFSIKPTKLQGLKGQKRALSIWTKCIRSELSSMATCGDAYEIVCMGVQGQFLMMSLSKKLQVFYIWQEKTCIK